MKPFMLVGAAISTISRVCSHMILAYPPSLRYEGNHYVEPASIDYSLSSPLNADGSNFPCKGYQNDLGTEAGSSVVTWAVGNSYNFTLIGGATQGGGSCQVSLSYDMGTTFTTIYSYIGGCPVISPPGGSFDFTIPSDAPIGVALFAWTWFNEVGNREMYMNCASVTINEGTSDRKRSTNLAFSSRPSIFVANVQNGCSTIENTDISFPDPGPDVIYVSTHPGGISGSCRPLAGIGSFGSSGGSTATQASQLSTSGPFDASTMQYLSHFMTISTSYLSTSDTIGSQANPVTSISNTVESESMAASSTTTLSHGGVKFTDSQPSYLFNPQSTENIAIYFGQTPVTNGTTLAAQCADSNIDVVILASVISQTYSGPYPKVNFGAACGGQTGTMVSEAIGLLYCPELAADITTCQSTYGKKVLLSVGGVASQIVFTSAAQASAFADMLWELFGPPSNIDINLRPFGNVSVDGFDIDNEDNDPANYQVLGSTLRTHFSSYASKTFFLSSAPQCPFPDASNPLDLLLICDFVWVQFYNNQPCEIGTSGFDASIKQWSQVLLNSTISPSPRLFLGSPAWSAAGSTSYGNIGTPEGMEHVTSNVKQMNLQNFGGVMFWDGPEGMLNVEGGKSIIAWAKTGLVAQN